MKGPNAKQLIPLEIDEYDNSRPKSTYNKPAATQTANGTKESCSKLRLSLLIEVPVMKNLSVQAKEDWSFVCQEASTVTKKSILRRISENTNVHRCLNFAELAVPENT
jgi:hypothetical protein